MQQLQSLATRSQKNITQSNGKEWILSKLKTKSDQRTPSLANTIPIANITKLSTQMCCLNSSRTPEAFKPQPTNNNYIKPKKARVCLKAREDLSMQVVPAVVEAPPSMKWRCS